jgi:hypothetical protein
VSLREQLSSPRRRAIARLWAFACALVALLVPSAAWAYAPMCNESAQTIDAPAPIYPSKSGQISAVPDCELEWAKLGSAPAPDPGQPLLTAEAIDRALASGAPIPPCARSTRLQLQLDELGQGSAGAGRDVFRPPRH